MELLTTPEYSDEEHEGIFSYFLALKTEQIQTFLLEHHLTPRTGTKLELGRRIKDWLSEGEVTYGHLVKYLDELVPWEKQHVYLYKGPTSSTADWKDSTWVGKHLKKHGVDSLLNINLPLILPTSLRLSSITHTAQKLRVTAIERREAWLRDEGKDEARTTKLGADIQLRAYVRLVTRGVIAFEWDLVSNTAFLQIIQLPSVDSYENAKLRFKNLVVGRKLAYFGSIPSR